MNSGPWSDGLAIGNGFDPVGGTTRTAEIELVGLAPGTYKVQVRGRDFAGRQQSGLTESRLWTVDPSFTQLRINEALASNTAAFEHAGSYPDLIELYNGGANPVDLSGMQLSDDSAQAAVSLKDTYEAVFGDAIPQRPETFPRCDLVFKRHDGLPRSDDDPVA